MKPLLCERPFPSGRDERTLTFNQAAELGSQETVVTAHAVMRNKQGERKMEKTHAADKSPGVRVKVNPERVKRLRKQFLETP